MEDAITVARFLIEDNNEDWVLFDENRTNSVTIIKSVFKNLIKNYSLFGEEESKKLLGEMAHVIAS